MDSSKNSRGPNLEGIGEAFRLIQEPPERRPRPKAANHRGSGPTDSAQEAWVPEKPGARQGAAGDDEEDMSGAREMSDLTPRGDPGTSSDLEPTPEDRRHSSEPAPSEQIGEMGRFNGLVPGKAQCRSGGESGRERSGRAHAKPLTDGQVVTQGELDGTRLRRRQATNDLEGDW